jgi:hypothetical protein
LSKIVYYLKSPKTCWSMSKGFGFSFTFLDVCPNPIKSLKFFLLAPTSNYETNIRRIFEFSKYY